MAAEADAGTLKPPSIAELFTPELRRTTIVTTLMFACSYGAAFGAIQQMPQIMPGLPEVKAQVQTAVAAATKDKPAAKGREWREAPRANNTKRRRERHEGAGNRRAGRAAFCCRALPCVIVSRRTLLRVFQIPGLILMPSSSASSPSRTDSS